MMCFSLVKCSRHGKRATTARCVRTEMPAPVPDTLPIRFSIRQPACDVTSTGHFPRSRILSPRNPAGKAKTAFPQGDLTHTCAKEPAAGLALRSLSNRTIRTSRCVNPPRTAERRTLLLLHPRGAAMSHSAYLVFTTPENRPPSGNRCVNPPQCGGTTHPTASPLLSPISSPLSPALLSPISCSPVSCLLPTPLGPPLVRGEGRLSPVFYLLSPVSCSPLPYLLSPAHLSPLTSHLLTCSPLTYPPPRERNFTNQTAAATITAAAQPAISQRRRPESASSR